MLEIEQKYCEADHDRIETALAHRSPGAWAEREEADHYLNAPDRDFAKTQEAFRLRRVGERNYLTYKGPRHDAEVKIRTELEIPLRDGEGAAQEMLRLLIHLGYRSVATVVKKRRMTEIRYRDFPITICLDEVKELGRFVELEILAGEDRKEEAEAALRGLEAELGLTAVERHSYLTLLLAR